MREACLRVQIRRSCDRVLPKSRWPAQKC